MTTRKSRLSAAHLARLREVAHPGVREVEVAADELVMLLNEIEEGRILVHAPEEPPRIMLKMDEALTRWNAAITVVIEHAGNADDIDQQAVALGYFLGLGLSFATAQHLSLSV